MRRFVGMTLVGCTVGEVGEVGGRDTGTTDALSTSTDAVPIGCVEREELDPYWVDFEVVGATPFEGEQLVVLTRMGLAFEPDACTTRTTLPIEGDRVAVTLEGRTDGAAYPLAGAFVDRGGDGRCDVDEDLAWFLFGSVAPGETMTLEIHFDRFGFHPYACEEIERDVAGSRG